MEYDKFQIGNTSVGTTNVPLGYNNSGTVVVPPNYKLKISRLNIINAGTATATVTISAVKGTEVIKLMEIAAAAQGSLNALESTVLLKEDQNVYIDEGYYPAASISTGTGSVLGVGEFILE